jgi:hypothetical protein
MPDETPAPVVPASPEVPATPPNPAPAAAAASPDPAAPPAAPNAAPAEPPKVAWPENWREVAAGDDAKKLARLQRFTDPMKAMDALIEAQNKIRAGEFAKPLPADATDEQKAEWRAANGVPEKPEAYFDKLPNGLVIGEEDQPLFEGFAKEMHGLNMPAPMMHKAVEWYYGLQERAIEERQAKDLQEAAATIEVLKDEWGGDFKANKAHVVAHLDATFGKELSQQLMDATLPNGTRLFNHPDVVKAFAATARELNPVGIIPPAGNENSGVAVETEINSLKKLMGNPNSEYWKGPTAEKNQARYRQLLEWQSKAAEKGRAA